MPTLISHCTWLSWSSGQTASGVTPRQYPHGQFSPTFIKTILLFPTLRSAAMLRCGDLRPRQTGSCLQAAMLLSARLSAPAGIRWAFYFSHVFILQYYRRVCAEQCWRADEDHYMLGLFFPHIFEKTTQNYLYKRQHLLRKPGPGKLLL